MNQFCFSKHYFDVYVRPPSLLKYDMLRSVIYVSYNLESRAKPLEGLSPESNLAHARM